MEKKGPPLGSHMSIAGGVQTALARGADRVIAMEAPELARFLVEPYAACLEQLVAEYKPEIMIAGATSTGRTLMPYVAVKIHAGLTADCTELDIEPETNLLLQTRPTFGGNLMATIRCERFRPQMATARPKVFQPAERQDAAPGKVI